MEIQFFVRYVTNMVTRVVGIKHIYCTFGIRGKQVKGMDFYNLVHIIQHFETSIIKNKTIIVFKLIKYPHYQLHHFVVVVSG